MSKPAIIILHGWSLSGKTFFPLAEELVKHGYQVFVPDLPGFGSSLLPSKSLSLSDYADFLEDYILEKKLKSPALIGHSFGGRVSLKYLQMHPKSVRALILSGTPGYSPVSRKKLIFFIHLAKVGGAIFSFPVLSFFQDTIRRLYYYVVGARDFYRADGVMRETFKSVVAEELVTPMQSVSVPCLLLWGEEDTLVPVSVAEKMRQTIPGAKLVVLPGDHGVSFRRPVLFSQSVIDFLKQI